MVSTSAGKRARTWLVAVAGTAAICLTGSPAAGVIDCSNTITFGTNYTAVDDYHHNGQSTKPCIRVLGGTTVNFNGHQLTCGGNCGVAVSVANQSNNATVKNGTFLGGFLAAVAAESPGGQTVAALNNTINIEYYLAIGLRDVHRASGNVIKSTFLGTAIQWAPTLATNFVRDNYISCQGCTYGIKDVSSATVAADIEKNYVETPNGYLLWVPGYRDISDNVLVGTSSSNFWVGGFGANQSSGNLCNAELRSIDDEQALCANHDPVAPFALP